MYSSLKALDAAATAPTNRSTAFQPKVKVRARKGAEDTKVSENATQPAQPAQQSDTIPVNAHVQEPVRLDEQIVSPVDPPSPLPPLPPRQKHVPKPASKANPYGPVPPPKPAKKRAAKKPSAEKPVDKTGEPSRNRRVPSRSTPRKRRVNPDEEIDPSTMSMKTIIELGDARERKKLRTEAATKQDQQPESSGSSKPKEKELMIPLAPQVEIVDGKLVINQKSMEINARAQADFSSYRRIDESAPKLNYASYMKDVKRDRWKPEETEKFYKAIQQFGCDFAAIEQLFPGKSRRRVKLKYKKEMAKNALRLTNSLFEDSRGDTSQYDELLSKLTAEAAKKGDFDFTWDNITGESNQPEEAEGSGMQAENNDGHSNENSGVVDPEFNDEEMEDPACSNIIEESSPQMEDEQQQNDEQMRTEENRTTTSFPLFAYQMEENVEQPRTEENQTSSFPIFAYQMEGC